MVHTRLGQVIRHGFTHADADAHADAAAHAARGPTRNAANQLRQTRSREGSCHGFFHFFLQVFFFYWPNSTQRSAERKPVRIATALAFRPGVMSLPQVCPDCLSCARKRDRSKTHNSPSLTELDAFGAVCNRELNVADAYMQSDLDMNNGDGCDDFPGFAVPVGRGSVVADRMPSLLHGMRFQKEYSHEFIPPCMCAIFSTLNLTSTRSQPPMKP